MAGAKDEEKQRMGMSGGCGDGVERGDQPAGRFACEEGPRQSAGACALFPGEKIDGDKLMLLLISSRMLVAGASGLLSFPPWKWLFLLLRSSSRLHPSRVSSRAAYRPTKKAVRILCSCSLISLVLGRQ